MKKALSFAVALGLVAGMASSAIAEDMLSIGGDARWRGVYKNNTTDASDAAADKIQAMDQRYRLNATLKINDDVKINTRLILADQIFGNNFPINNALTYSSLTGRPAAAGDNAVTADRYNMTINMFGGTYIIGRQEASWGNKFLGWGANVDRLKAVYKSGGLTYGGYLQKSVEGNDAWGDGDSDTYAAFVIGQAGGTKWGVLANYIYSDPTSTDSEDGYLLDPFFLTKAGAATIMGELVYIGGDAADNPAGDDYYGGFLGAAIGMDALTIKGLVAYYDGNMGSTGGRDCDNDFAPTLLIGTCNETAVIDFGETTVSTDDSTYLLTVGADFRVNDKLSLGAMVGYLMASEEANATTGLVGTNLANVGAQDATMMEVDLTARYALAQNASYHFGVAYAQVDEFSTADDDMIVIGNRIDVNF